MNAATSGVIMIERFDAVSRSGQIELIFILTKQGEL